MNIKRAFGLTMSVAIVAGVMMMSGCKKNDGPQDDNSTDYKVQYSLRVITDNANPLGRETIVNMTKASFEQLGVTLTQKSESVWGYEAAYPEQLDAARAAYSMFDESDCVPDLDDVPGLLFYGIVEEEVRLTAGSKIIDRDADQERYTLPDPDDYRYVINRDVWDVKSFEVDLSTPLNYADDYSSCMGYVKINGGSETRLAYFTAAGVDVYKAQSRTDVEARIVYMIDNQKNIKAFLSTLDGSSVNMPITLEKLP